MSEEPIDPNRFLDAVRRTLVGCDEESARQRAADHGWQMRAVMVDGKRCIGTCDIAMNRANVVIENGKVSEVVSIG